MAYLTPAQMCERMSLEQFDKAFPRVTRGLVDEWLSVYGGASCTRIEGGVKGIHLPFRKPPNNFFPLGKTWREVLRALAVDGKEPPPPPSRPTPFPRRRQ